MVAFSVSAEDIYITDQTSGGDTGADCANAHSRAWFNISGNWGAGAGKISAGDTVHFCGTITNTLTVLGSGEPGNRILFQWEAGAKLSTTAIADGNPFIKADTFANLTFDGGANGLIEFTANGSGMSFQRNLFGVTADGTGSSNVTVQNLRVTNIFKRIPDGEDSDRLGTCVSLTGSGMLVQNCHLSECDGPLTIGFNTGRFNNVVLRSNTITRFNHGITFATSQLNAFLSDIQIYANMMDGEDTWEVGSGTEVGIHRNCIIMFDEAADESGGFSNIVVYGNSFRMGKTPMTETAGTGGVFLGSVPIYRAVRIYNNLFTLPSALNFRWANGFVVGSATNGSFTANNTFIGGSAGVGNCINSGAGMAVWNNLAYNIGTGILVADGGSPVGGGGVLFGCDFNVWYFGDGSFNMRYPPGFYTSFSSWKSDTGFDANSKTNQPNLNGYIPTVADTIARASGTNLSAYFTTDFYGNTRPASGAWTIGAFENVVTARMMLIGRVPITGNVQLR